MSLSMYQALVPVFLHGLKNLSAIFNKAAGYAAERKIDPAVWPDRDSGPGLVRLLHGG